MNVQPHTGAENRADAGHWVYLLDDPKNERVKIGYSSNPCARLAALSSRHPSIDLSSSVMIESDLRQLEYIVQKTFESFRQPLSRYQEGGTEWFDRNILDEAIELARHIGRVRGQEYPVHRDLTAFAAAGRQVKTGTARCRNWRQGFARSSPDVLEAELVDAALECAAVCAEILAERELDALITDGSHWAVLRTFNRDDEPEMWESGFFETTRWANRLWISSHVTSRRHPGDGKSFHGFIGVRTELEDQRGSEWLYLPNDWQAHAGRSNGSVKAHLFGVISTALSSLPIRNVLHGTAPFDYRMASESD